jgi:phosphate:Na+ symporter
MFNKVFFIAILIVLAYWFWISPDFKDISAWVSIFLFWMIFLKEWFKSFTWWTLEKILQKSTNKTWKSMIFWFSASSIMQSSSLVAVLTISFLSAELITLIQALWIILGSNIGTTTWAWLIAGFWMKINIWAYAMPMIVFGMIFSFRKNSTLKWLWSILAWLGFLFLWIHYMKEWFESFQSTINLIDYAMTWFIWVLVYVWIGMLATIVMQSSHATIILVIAALATWQVTYENALALVIWANIGTTITSVIGSLTANINWKRLALADITFKTITWTIFILFIFQITWIVDSISSFIGISSDNYTLKLAVFHTLFNVSWAIIMAPLLPKIIKLVTKIFPEKEEENSKNENITNKYLNKAVFDFPDTAIISLIKENRHLYEQASMVILKSIWLEKNDIEWEINFEELKKKIKILEPIEIDELYNIKIKNLYSEIINYASIAQWNNDEKYNNNFYHIKEASRNIAEVIKLIKHLQKNLKKYIKSNNPEIKKQYEDLICDLIKLLININLLSKEEKIEEKLKILAEIEIKIKEDDIISNGTIWKLIRENKISNEMATSLMNDSHYKNDIFKNLLNISHIIFNNEISEEVTEIKDKKDKKINNWFWNTLWLSDKKLEKTVKKLRSRRSFLKTKLKDKKIENKSEIEKEIKNIDFVINKYKS